MLEEARKGSRLALERAAEVLRVPASVLAKLERGDYDHLPPDAFLCGIVRKYAAFLGLEPDVCVNRYLHESGRLAGRKSGPTDLLPANRFSARRRLYLSFGAKELAAILGAGAFLYLVWQVGGFVRPPSIDLDPAVRDTTIARTSAFVVSGTLRGAERIMINGVRIGADKEGRFRHAIELREGENIVEFRAENARGKVTTLVQRITYQPGE